MKFEHECVRCGFCCLSENCSIAQITYNIPKRGAICPALKFDFEGVSSCDMMNHMNEENRAKMGAGKGCCIRARIITLHKTLDYASMSKEIKFEAVRVTREKLCQ